MTSYDPSEMTEEEADEVADEVERKESAKSQSTATF